MQFPHIVSPILLLLPKLKATLQHTHSLWSHLSMCISTAWHQKYVCVSWTPQRQRELAALQFSSLLRVSSPNQCKALSWSAAIPVPKSIVGCLHSFQQYRESAVWVQNVTDCGTQLTRHIHLSSALISCWVYKTFSTPPIYNLYPIELSDVSNLLENLPLIKTLHITSDSYWAYPLITTSSTITSLL